MKKILIGLIIAPLFSLNSFAIDFEKGANVKDDVSPRLLRNILRKGNGMIGSTRIVISKDATIPGRYKKKFEEMKLSGETVPSVGAKSDDVIFITSF